ncbi:MAG: hypothetical protein AABY22_01650, partial [Nanoarchaeota archaeon]
MEKKNNLPRGLTKDDNVKSLASRYLDRAYKNIELTNIISELSKNREAQKALKLPDNYSNNEWVIITSYYSMYSASLALLAKIGYKSDIHTSTIWAIEKFFIEKKIIEPEYLLMLNNAKDQISKTDVSNLSKGKEDREKAQYNVTEATTRAIAEAN